MVATNSNHCQIVGAALTGQQPVDEQTLNSLDALAERLERVKQMGKGFSDICFSPAVKDMAKHNEAMTVA